MRTAAALPAVAPRDEQPGASALPLDPETDLVVLGTTRTLWVLRSAKGSEMARAIAARTAMAMTKALRRLTAISWTVAVVMRYLLAAVCRRGVLGHLEGVNLG